MNGIKGADLEESIEYLKEKLVSDEWVIIEANNDVLTEIEETIYTPGTPANSDFEISIIQGKGRISYFGLARKVESLSKFIGDIDLKGVVIITIKKPIEKIMEVDVVVCTNKLDIEVFANHYLTSFKKWLDEDTKKSN